ncbi:hypothetical protein F4804DRAFT_281679 [Jackrogersella minutella]|nr:hypothetical protein F4804DRAFT_281679 [Jackrogersella minutella]
MRAKSVATRGVPVMRAAVKRVELVCECRDNSSTNAYTFKPSRTLACSHLDLLYHYTQIDQIWAFLWVGTHARFDDCLERRRNRPFDEFRNWPVRVNHTFDAVGNIIYVGPVGPPRVLRAPFEGDLGGRPVPPQATLDIADN